MAVSPGLSLVPNLGSSVVLEKIDPDAPLMDDTDEVQLTNSIVQNQPPNTTATSNYAFCAPADTYEVQEFQLPVPSQSVTPIAMASPSPVPDGFATVTIPGAGRADGRRAEPDANARDQMPDHLLVFRCQWHLPRNLQPSHRAAAADADGDADTVKRGQL